MPAFTAPLLTLMWLKLELKNLAVICQLHILLRKLEFMLEISVLFPQ